MSFGDATEWAERHVRGVVAISGGLVALISLADWIVEPDVSLGAFYVVPIALAAIVLNRPFLLLLAAGCAIFREAGAPFRWTPDYGYRIAFTTSAFSVVGLLISEMNRNRRLVLEHLRYQSEAERQMLLLIEASPLSILIADGKGRILLANAASRQLLGDNSDLSERTIFDALPTLRNTVPDMADDNAPGRIDIETTGLRASGEAFFAHVWITVYRLAMEAADSFERRIAVVVWDASDDLRGRELAQSESLEITADVLVASLSHEVRNFSVAAAALAARIEARPGFQNDADLQALSRVIQGLTNFAAAGLRQNAQHTATVVDLGAALDHERITLQLLAEEQGLSLDWRITGPLPSVRIDHGTLSRVFLNLLANSERATRAVPRRQATVETAREGAAIVIRFLDNGSGVSDPESLFQPFSSATGGSGLGLYVSRAVLRSFGGDLVHEPRPVGSCFAIRLLTGGGRHADSIVAD